MRNENSREQLSHSLEQEGFPSLLWKRSPGEAQQAEDALRAMVDGTSGKVGEDFLRSLTRNLAIILQVRYAFVSEYLDGAGSRARTVSIWMGERFGENFAYSTENTPCQRVVQDGIAYYFGNVQSLFPTDEWIKTAGVESYLAILFSDLSGQPLGHMGVMDDKPMTKSQSFESILRLFATRAGAELERIRTEQALRESEERFRQMAENIQEVFWIRDAASKEIQYVSPAYHEIWGRTCDSLCQEPRTFLDTVHAEDREGVRAALEKLSQSRLDQEYRIVRPDGSMRWIWDRGFPIPGVAGQVERVVGIAQDITRYKHLERILRDFLANVSHEFKTPLTAICGFAETLLDRGLEDPQSSREFLEIIRENSLRLTRLTDDLLKLSRIEAGKLDLEFHPVPVSELLAACAKTTRLKSDLKQLALQIHCSADVPPVRGDASRLQEVLQNLLDNAVQYTLPGGCITVRADALDNQVVISVADTGIGIDSAEQDKIFERFYRTDSARLGEVGGTGLGLSIAKNLVEAHGGRIEVASEAGRGSTFTVFLPAA